MNVGAVASMSLDPDDKWTYLKTHGDPAWADCPSYLHYLVSRILKFLAEREIINPVQPYQ